MKKIFIIIFLLLLAIIGYMAYEDLGFNTYLSREPIPASTDPLAYDQNYPDMLGEKIQSTMDGQFVGSGIKADNITAGFMSFDHARGGSLILGGQNNVNGTFALRDSEDKDKVTMDKDGMVIQDGSMTVKTATGKTIIDSKGVISDSIFASFNTSAAALNQNITSEIPTYTVFTGSGINIVLDRPKNILFIGKVTYTLVPNGSAGDFSAKIWIDIFLNGVQLGRNADIQSQLAAYVDSPVQRYGPLDTLFHGTIFQIKRVNAGAYYIDLRGALSSISASDTPALQIYSFNLSYIILGS